MAKCAEWGVSTLVIFVKCNESELYRMFGDNAAGCAPGSWVYPGYRLREWQPHKCRTHRRAMAIKQETSDYDRGIPMELVPDWNCFIVSFVNSCTFFAFFAYFLCKIFFIFWLKIIFCRKAYEHTRNVLQRYAPGQIRCPSVSSPAQSCKYFLRWRRVNWLLAPLIPAAHQPVKRREA